VPSMGCGKPW